MPCSALKSSTIHVLFLCSWDKISQTGSLLYLPFVGQIVLVDNHSSNPLDIKWTTYRSK